MPARFAGGYGIDRRQTSSWSTAGARDGSEEMQARFRLSVAPKVGHRLSSVTLGADGSAPSRYLGPGVQCLSSDCFSLLPRGWRLAVRKDSAGTRYSGQLLETLRTSWLPASIASHSKFRPIRFLVPSSFRARPGVNRAGEEQVHQAGCASGSSAECASSSTATATTRLTDGKSSRKTSRESPASR